MCSLIFLCSACNNNNNYRELMITKEEAAQDLKRTERAFIQIDSAKKSIATGDLIVRTGNDFTSESLRTLNRRDKTYSHCGIASIENDTVFVYHALGGEWNPDQKIRRDALDVFASPLTNRGIGIYRFRLSPVEITQLMITVSRLYQMGIMFDMKFDLQTNDRMYCAEFVYKSFMMGTVGKLKFNSSHIGQFSFIGVDDLFLQPLCTVQKKILFR